MSDDITRSDEVGDTGEAGAGDGSAENRLDCYVDGLMTDSERARFEAGLAGDAGARGGVEAQGRIDARLRVLFAPPARIEIPARAGVAGMIGGAGQQGAGAEGTGVSATRDSGATAGRAGRRAPRWVGLAMAAAAAIVAGGGAGYWWFVIGTAAPYRQPAEIYQVQAASGFTPEWVCTTDEEFVKTVRDRFGEPGLLPMGTMGVEVIGWAYNTPVLSNRTATLMTRVEGREVLVLIDSAEKDVNLRQAGEAVGAPGLNLFKRRLGGLVLYEVTPLDEARVIPAFVGGG